MHPRHEQLLAELALRRARLLDELSRTEAQLLRSQPSPSEWSLLQVAEHLELVERGIIRMLRDPRNATRTLRRRPKNWVGYAAVWVVMNTGIRVSVPEPVRKATTPSGEGTLDSLRTRWSATAAALEEHFANYTAEDYRRFVGLHPVGGPLTPTQVLLFIRRHFDHHLRQVRRIRSALARRRTGARSAPA